MVFGFSFTSQIEAHEATGQESLATTADVQLLIKKVDELKKIVLEHVATLDAVIPPSLKVISHVLQKLDKKFFPVVSEQERKWHSIHQLRGRRKRH